MKKIITAFLTFFVVCANAQIVDITVNSGTSGSIVIGQDVYHVSEMIYLNSEIGASNFTSAATQIQKVGFYVSEGSLGDPTAAITPYKIYMKNVAAGTTTLAAGNYSTTGYTLVYNGVFNPTQSGWYTITLSTPFTRTANLNLQVLLVRSNGSANPGYFFNASMGNANNSAATSLRRYNGATASIACTTSIFRPAIRLQHVYAIDAGLHGIINPISSCYGSPQNLGIVLMNDGTNSIAAGAASVVLKVGGANRYTSASTVNASTIQPGGSEIISFNGIDLNNPGINYDTAIVSLSGDGSRSNDTLKSSTPTSRVIHYSEFPFLEDADDNLPLLSFQDIVQGDKQLWSISGNYANFMQSDTLYPKSGAKFFIFNGYTSPEGDISRLYSRCIMLPATLAPNPPPVSTVSFWMSHDNISNQSLDSLYLTVSVDKGLTWTRVAGFQRPAALSPSWTQEDVDISAYNGQVIQLGFEGVSKNGNSFGLDDITVYYSGIAGSAPNISVSPLSAAYGDTVTIKGSNLLGTSAVSFGGVSALSFNVVNDSTIKAVVGNGSSGNVTLVTTAGLIQLAGFNYLKPLIRSIAPLSASYGDTVIVNVANISGVSAVSFGGVSALSFNVVNDSTIIAVVGFGSSGNVTLVTRLGPVQLAGFNYLPPSIRIIAPLSAAYGDTVTIKGDNLLSVSAVSFGGISALSFNVINDSTIKAVVGNCISGLVSVQGVGADSATFSGFTYLAPKISAFIPQSGAIGTSVTITGNGFDVIPENNIVFFGATKADVTIASYTSLTIIVPMGATYQNITVTNLITGLTAYSSNPFNVTFNGHIDFLPKEDINLGIQSSCSSIGDVDGDGKSDLVVANSSSGKVSVLRNISAIGTVSFAPKVDFIASANMSSVCIGDLDGDGKPDLVVSNYANATVSVFINTSTIGTVSFAPKVNFSTGPNPQSVRIGDIDGDGKPDLAVANYGSNYFSILRNTTTNGILNFASKLDFATGTNPSSLSIGDIDGDRKPDLVVANFGDNTITVSRNSSFSGTIRFATTSSFTVRNSPYSLSIGDLDGDGKPELSIATGYNYISILRNTSGIGSVNFAPYVNLFTTDAPYYSSIGDVDGDGKADLAVANTYSNTLSVLRNTSTIGSLSFAPIVNRTTATYPRSLNIGDLDGDGKPDLSVSNSDSSKSVSIFLQVNGMLNINSITPFSGTYGDTIIIKGTNFLGINAVRFGGISALSFNTENDSTIKAIVGIGISGLVSVQSVTSYASFPGFTYEGPKISDFTPKSGPIGTIVTITGKGFNEIATNNVVFFGATKAVVTSASTNSLTVIVPVGATYQYISITNLPARLSAYTLKPFNVTLNGSIDFTQKVDSTTLYPTSIVVGDLDGDGKPDLAIGHLNGIYVSVFRNSSTNNTVSFEPEVDFSCTGGIGTSSLSIGDIDGDGKLDLFTTNSGISVLRNTSTIGSISFANEVRFSVSCAGSSCTIGDLDGDGKPDLTALNGDYISIFRNTSSNGLISFASQVDLDQGGLNNWPATSAKIGDVDGDGKPDIVTVSQFGCYVSVFKNYSENGYLFFYPNVNFVTDYEPNSVTIGDINGDGKPDIVTTNYSSLRYNNTVSVLVNSSSGSTNSSYIHFLPKIDFTTGKNPRDVAIGDIDGDDKPDLAIVNSGDTSVSILRNISANGNVSFANNVNFVTGLSPYSVKIGDLNGDGLPDLATANYYGNSFSVLIQHSLLPCDINYWNGSISIAWENPSNWSCGTVPGANTEVYIESGKPRYPEVSSQATCKKVYVSPSATIKVNTGYSLNIVGGN